MIDPLLVAGYLAAPLFVLWLCLRFAIARKIGAVILCYLIGIAFGNSGLDLSAQQGTLSHLQEIAVGLALPLLLMSSNARRWIPVAGRALGAFGIAVLAVCLVTLGGALLLSARPDAWQVAGMSAAVYSGGTPNLAAVAEALAIPNDTFIVFHTYDTAVSLLYILFMSSLARPLLLRWLRPFQAAGGAANGADLNVESLSAFSDMLRGRRAVRLLLSLCAAGAMMAAAYGAGLLVPGNARSAVSILTLTSLGIVASLLPALHRIERTFQLGFYLLMVFCLVVGTRANLRSLADIQWDLLLFVAAVIFGSLLVALPLCRIFRVDADTCIVTHVSAICSPPFVPVVTAAIRNAELLPVGITTGIVGYAVGNYLGIGLAWAVRWMLS
ncbi:MAG: DUF819 family protein [Myxococcales bacterium]|nr:DUF819 family protein [Myxococcales bacterium]